MATQTRSESDYMYMGEFRSKCHYFPFIHFRSCDIAKRRSVGQDKLSSQTIRIHVMLRGWELSDIVLRDQIANLPYFWLSIFATTEGEIGQDYLTNRSLVACRFVERNELSFGYVAKSFYNATRNHRGNFLVWFDRVSTITSSSSWAWELSWSK